MASRGGDNFEGISHLTRQLSPPDRPEQQQRVWQPSPKWQPPPRSQVTGARSERAPSPWPSQCSPREVRPPLVSRCGHDPSGEPFRRPLPFHRKVSGAGGSGGTLAHKWDLAELTRRSPGPLECARACAQFGLTSAAGAGTSSATADIKSNCRHDGSAEVNLARDRFRRYPPVIFALLPVRPDEQKRGGGPFAATVATARVKAPIAIWRERLPFCLWLPAPLLSIRPFAIWVGGGAGGRGDGEGGTGDHCFWGLGCQNPGGGCAAPLGPGMEAPATCGPGSAGPREGRQRSARNLFLPRQRGR